MNHPDRASTAARVVVRRSTVADADGFARMLSNPEVYPQLLQMPYGSAEHWRARLADNAVPGKPRPVAGGRGRRRRRRRRRRPASGRRVAAAAPCDDAGHAGAARVAAAGRRHAAAAVACATTPTTGSGCCASSWRSTPTTQKAQALYKRFGFVEEGRAPLPRAARRRVRRQPVDGAPESGAVARLSARLSVAVARAAGMRKCRPSVSDCAR